MELTDPTMWELNWAAAPRSMFHRLGGFEEAHDAGFYSCDNLAVSYRAERLGYRAYIDWTNECVGFPHQLYWPGQSDGTRGTGASGRSNSGSSSGWPTASPGCRTWTNRVSRQRS